MLIPIFCFIVYHDVYIPRDFWRLCVHIVIFFVYNRYYALFFVLGLNLLLVCIGSFYLLGHNLTERWAQSLYSSYKAGCGYTTIQLGWVAELCPWVVR